MAAMAGHITRTRPNILVTGTPGTGKTITCSEVADKTGYKHVDVGQVAKVNRYYEGWDEQYQCPILDEDKVCSGAVVKCSHPDAAQLTVPCVVVHVICQLILFSCGITSNILGHHTTIQRIFSRLVIFVKSINDNSIVSKFECSIR